MADLQDVLQPRLVAIDAVTAGEGRMLTPIPRQLSLIIMGNNQPAIDAVCCAIIGVDPSTVAHLKLASDRGFGPLDLAHIALSGDVTLPEAQARAQGFKVGLVRVEKYFEGTAITAYAGPPPEREGDSYCWGGCPGAIEEAIELLRLFDAELDQKMAKMPRLHVVFGAYRGGLDVKPGEKVVFIGDCAQWKGRLHGQDVEVENLYQPRETKDPHAAKHEDIYQKMVAVTARYAASRGQSHLRLHGCPVSVAEQVLALVAFSGARNPYFEKSEVLGFNRAYFAWKAATAVKRVKGQPYQRPGAAVRGAAKVE